MVTLNKITYMVVDLQLLLRWKLGDRNAEQNKKKVAELKALWLEHKTDDILDIVFPHHLKNHQSQQLMTLSLGELDSNNSRICWCKHETMTTPSFTSSQTCFLGFVMREVLQLEIFANFQKR